MTATLNPPHSWGGGSRNAADGGGRQTLRRPEVYTARRLRAEMTLPEVMLWKALKGNSQGLKFRRQHPIGSCVVDFYCAAGRLVIEVDGKAHDMGNRLERDIARMKAIEAKGYRIVRIAASDILEDVQTVAASIVQVATPLRQSLRDCHLPTSGEDC